ncbi:MAG: alcohol dehydrogenase catalytic domain-containing protein, partial [Bdellovibrionota bacterium]
MNKINAYGYFMREVGQKLEKKDFVIEDLPPGHIAVKVAGCGLCHTDITFLNGSVKTKHPLPLVLGHEISGAIVASGAAAGLSLIEGKKVIIPAVLPCGECELCRAGRDNICQKQKMPGNDFHGGFASHIVVPGKYVCELPQDLKGNELWQLSVIADAVTTPYQALIRSGLKSGELAIVIGVGGIGIYMVQHA